MSANDDYDKLSPEEREARDKADRAREAAEQAGATPCSDRPFKRASYRHPFGQRYRTSGLSNWVMSILLSQSLRARVRATSMS